MNTTTTKNTKPFLALFFIAAAIAFLPVLYFASRVTPKNDQNNVMIPIATNAVTDKGEQQSGPGLPVRLTIPSIQLDAAITYVGLAPDGSIGVPKGPYDVAWFKLGPRPGQKGSAIITGHFGPWRSGAHSVFDNLYKLKQGDKIYIKDNKGMTIAFVVTGSHIYKSNESPKEVFNNNDGMYLNLITCNGDWIASQKTYTDRLVMFTKLIKS